MKARTTLLLTLGVLGCCAAAVAQTDPLQPAPPPPAEHGIAPYDVVATVRSMNLDPVTAPIRRGTRYVVHTIDHWGNAVRVVVDAQVAQIVAMRPLRSVMRQDDDESLAREPHVIYAGPQRHAAPALPPPPLPRLSRINPTGPTVKPAVMRPKQPPLPRVRPPIADEQASLHPDLTVKPDAKPAAKPETKVETKPPAEAEEKGVSGPAAPAPAAAPPEGEQTASQAMSPQREAAPSGPPADMPATPPATPAAVLSPK